MSKQVKKQAPVKKEKQNGLSGFDLGKYIPEKFRTLAAILGILILLIIFFSPVMFGDKTIDSGDILQMKSTRAYIEKSHDGFSLWNPYLFGGMPAYATSTQLRWFDLSSSVYSLVTRIYSAVFSNYEAIYTFSFLLMGIMAFLFMRSRGAGNGISFFVAASMVFGTGLTVLYFIGHETKLMSLAWLPFLLMMLLKFQKQIKWLDVLLFTLAMHFLVLVAHIQIVYYIVLLTVIYFIFYFIYSAVIKDRGLTKQLLKSLGIMAAAAVVAVCMSFDTYMQLYEYAPYSQRGGSGITENVQAAKDKTGTEQYASNTRWSFSPGEVTTFLIPSYFGFGNSQYNGELSGGQDMKVNTYFGPMNDGVDAAMYMGVIIFILGMLAFFIKWKEPFIKFLAIVTGLFLLLSFGKNFTLIYNLAYNYLPKFDTFRAPSMILAVIQVLFPILAGFGVMGIIEAKEKKNIKFSNGIKYTAIIFSAIAILSLILTSVFSGWMIERVGSYANSIAQSNNQSSQMFTAFTQYIADMFTGDIHINLIIIALLFWVIYLFLNSKISKTILITGICVLALFDLYRISSRSATYQSAEELNAMYNQPGYVTAIKQQNDKEPFRIISLKQGQDIPSMIGSVNYSANYHTSFLLEDIAGYSSAKSKYFNDLYVSNLITAPLFWRMVGVKYIVTSRAIPEGVPGYALVGQDKTSFVYRNEAALPRAYFVDSVEVKSAPEFIELISKEAFDPKKKAFVENADFKIDVPGPAAYTKITGYTDERLNLEANATGNNFLFFSTNYMPKGWKALIDNKETNIYRTNHSFMGIIVPEGKHNVEFIYAPSSFYLGKNISLILNILLFAGIIAAVVFLFRKKKAVVAA